MTLRFRLRALPGALLGAVLFSACTDQRGAMAEATPVRAADAPLAMLPGPSHGQPLVFIAYGDMRFTDPAELEASRPGPRRALVARIATEHPAALFLNGDVPWHGGVKDDYSVYARETSAWRERGIPVFPALGNHEFSRCEVSECLENWWSAFPAQRGRRWYAVALGSDVYALNLDSDLSLLPGSEQRAWIEDQLSHLPASVRFVLISLHHPPVADPQPGKLADHDPRPSEISLADYLGRIARTSRARFIVSAGHTHNYERIERDGVMYLVSGGGGARPYEVVRSPADLYPGTEPENFHYVRFEVRGNTLSAQMVRLANPDAGDVAPEWQVRDQFTLTARGR